MAAVNLDDARALLLEDEGCVLHAYEDSRGFMTIGVGRCVDKRVGGGITHAEAMFLLDNDIDRAMTDIEKRYPWAEDLSDARQLVLLSMRFNLGAAGLSKFTRMLEAVIKHDYDEAADQMLASDWAKQVKGRARRLAEMMRRG